MSDLESASRKIFIGGLSYGTDDDKLREYFSEFGPVQDAVVMKDPVTRRSRGFGFITFDNPSFVDIALAQDTHTIDSRKVEAKRAVPRSEGDKLPSHPVAAPAAPKVATPKTNGNANHAVHSSSVVDSKLADEFAYNKIFVGGLHYDTRDAEFRNYFEQYGRVMSAEVMFNRETHKSRGFGFIIFESEDSVDLVCEEKEHSIDGKVVSRIQYFLCFPCNY